MKRSRTVVVSLLSATAISLTGCQTRKELKACVNPDNVMQDDDDCRQEQGARFIGPHYYHWLYGGRSRDGGYWPGRSVMFGGSPTPEPGVETATPSEARAHGGTISEGHVSFHGFGSTGHGSEGSVHGSAHGGAGE